MKSYCTGGSSVRERERKTSDSGELDGYGPSQAANIKAGKQFINDAKVYNESMSASEGVISRLSAFVSPKAWRKALTPDATQVSQVFPASQVSEVPTEGTRGNATSFGGDPDYEDRGSVPGAIPVGWSGTSHASATSTSDPK